MSEAEQNAEGLKKLEALMRGEKTQDAMADQVGGTSAASRAAEYKNHRGDVSASVDGSR